MTFSYEYYLSYILDMESPNSPERLRDVSKMSNLEVQLVSNKKTYHNVTKLTSIVVCLCLASFYFGFCLAYLSNVDPATLKQYFGPSAGQQSVIGGLIGGLPIGAAFGALLAPIFMRYLSRKNFVLLFNAIAILIAGIIQINNIILLFICRIIQGFLVGNFMAITPIYINQLVPVDIQGSFGALTQLLVVIGVVLAYLLGVIFSVTQANQEFVWRFLFSFTGLTALVLSILLIFNFIPESPVSLVEKGEIEQAKTVIAMFNTPDVVDKVLNDIKIKLASKAGPPQINETEVQSAMKGKEKQENGGKSVSLVSMRALFLGFQLPFMQQMSGTNMIVTEIGSIVEKYDKNLALYAPLLANIIQLIATAGSVWILTCFGRRSLILFGNLSLAIVDLIIGAMFLILVFNESSQAPVYVALVFIMVFMISYGFTIGPVVWLYVPEIIPAKYVPPATFMNWFGCSICVIVTPFVVQAVGSSYPVFFFFGVISLIFFFINFFLVVETKGLTLIEIAKKMGSS